MGAAELAASFEDRAGEQGLGRHGSAGLWHLAHMPI